MIKEIENIDEINHQLKEYKGANLFIEMYSSSFKRIFIGLNKPGTKDYIFLMGADCTYFQGYFSMQNVELKLDNFTENNNPYMILEDVRNKFLIKASFLGLLIGEVEDCMTKESKRKFMFLNN